MADITSGCLKYIDKKFSDEHEKVIRYALGIIGEYLDQGLSLTLRQIYYQFVGRGWMANKQTEYTRLGNIISDARLAGLIPWTAIEDRTRNLRGVPWVESPLQAFSEARDKFALDLWHNQHYRPEVWVEKEALVGVVADICNQLRVDFFACRGYNSQSEQWRAGQRLQGHIHKGQEPIVFHLGDHDPSGLDMTRDNRERLSMFAGVPINVQRLALNMPQIEQYDPPPNPAKVTDSRFTEYQNKFGDDSWELDALSPSVLRDLIANAVKMVRNEAAWDEACLEEAEDRAKMDEVIEEMRRAANLHQ